MQERFRKIVKPTVILLAIGFTYLLIHELTGFSLFCPIYKMFGVYCPGCGVSRMCFHLAHMEFYEAFSSNCVVFCLLPIALSVGIFHTYRFVRCGEKKLNKAEQIGIWIVAGLLIVFGVVRNLYPVGVLVPS